MGHSNTIMINMFLVAIIKIINAKKPSTFDYIHHFALGYSSFGNGDVSAKHVNEECVLQLIKLK